MQRRAALRSPRSAVASRTLRSAALLVLLLAGAAPGPVRSSGPSTTDYRNFEGLPVHPLAITPDGTRLLALNTPDARLEIRLIQAGRIDSVLGEVPVGLEPVSVVARNNSEAWVVNHVSDDVSVVDLATFHVKATIRVGDAPTDVAFAGTRAFVCVSGEDAVKLYDPASLAPPVVRPVFGRHPRCLAVGAGGSEVYVGVLDAGNQTTVLSAQEVIAGGGPPPPNPPATTDSIPNVGLIVQRVGGHWIDDGGPGPNPKTWDAFVPYSLGDVGIQVLSAATGDSLRVVPGVGTNVFNLAVGPGGTIYATNTEAENRTRFEPNLRGRFLRNRVTLVQGGSVVPVHLNPHIDYSVSPGPLSERQQSLAAPMDVVAAPSGSKVYVAAMGSGLVGVLDASGVVTNRIPTSLAADVSDRGPAGLALDSANHRLYVWNRITNTLSTLDTNTETFVSESPLRFDPGGPGIREGRKFLYAARDHSAHGDLACASCHIGGNMDNIAWDLGDPQGQKAPLPPGQLLPGLLPFNPMKGPMTTQSLRGLAGTQPFHWRGDRPDFTRFNPAFLTLMGAPDSLSTADMQRYTDFSLTIAYPPNPNRNLDNSLPDPPAGPNPARGEIEFDVKTHDGGTCSRCHAFPTGTNGQIIPGPVLQESQQFKIPQLRNLYEKTGFVDGPRVNRRGFGFLHDGSIDNLFDFLHLPVFHFASDTERRDLEAFLLSFDTGTPASVGREVTVSGGTKNQPATAAVLDSLYAEADLFMSDLVAHGFIGGVNRSYVYVGGRRFKSDYLPEGEIDADSLRGLAEDGGEITYLGVPQGAGQRMGYDRDRDGFPDRWELSLGSRPWDAASTPYVTAVGPPVAPVAATRLFPNAPNPFNPVTTIPFELGSAGRARLRVFDVRGRVVRTLVDQPLGAGRHEARWDGRDARGAAVASGRYYCRLTLGSTVRTRGMTLLK